MAQAAITLPASTSLDVVGSAPYVSFTGFDSTEYYIWSEIVTQSQVTVGTGSNFGWFSLTHHYQSDNYYIWFNKAGNGTNPNIPGKQEIEVQIEHAYSNIQIAEALVSALTNAGISAYNSGASVYSNTFNLFEPVDRIGIVINNVGLPGTQTDPAVAGKTSIKLFSSPGNSGAQNAVILETELTSLGLSSSVSTDRVDFDGFGATENGGIYTINVAGDAPAPLSFDGGVDAGAFPKASVVTATLDIAFLASSYSSEIAANAPEGNFADSADWRSIVYIYENAAGQRMTARYFNGGSGFSTESKVQLDNHMNAGALPVKMIVITDKGGDTLVLKGDDLSTNDDLIVAS